MRLESDQIICLEVGYNQQLLTLHFLQGIMRLQTQCNLLGSFLADIDLFTVQLACLGVIPNFGYLSHFEVEFANIGLILVLATRSSRSLLLLLVGLFGFVLLLLFLIIGIVVLLLLWLHTLTRLEIQTSLQVGNGRVYKFGKSLPTFVRCHG